jgi:predicted PurR-regulated permease PerM
MNHMYMLDNRLLSTLCVFAGILLLIYLLHPLIPAFCLALILVYTANPLTDFLEKYTRRRFLAAMTSFLVIIVSFVVLSIFLLGEVLSETARLVDYLQTHEVISNLDILQRISEPLAIQPLLTEDEFRLLTGVVVQLGNAVIQVFFGVLISFFVVWKDIHIPVKDERISQVITIIDRGIRNVISSLFITAIVTGLISIPIFYGFGLPYPLLLAALTGFLTLLPVIGAYLLYIPITVYLYFAQGLPDSLTFLVVCIVIISILPDVLVRPLAGRTREVGAIPLLTGFITGILVFGVEGIVLGPVIVIAAIAFWKVYLEEPKEKEKEEKLKKDSPK